jgi:thiamine biosynthesis lipoprotein
MARHDGWRIGRRRALAVIAGAAALPPLGPAWGGTPRLLEWRGTALGADATIRLYGGDERSAAEALAEASVEIERLENEFSLYRPTSALSRLNRDGRLDDPSLDMLTLLRLAVCFGDLTEGAFDITVQPLWLLYAAHFSRRPDDSLGPDEALVADAVRRVDYRRIAIQPHRITLPQGMAITLNGIGQGYITDRIAERLRARGWSDVLVDLGEQRALGSHPDGRPWTVKLPPALVPTQAMRTLPLSDRAIATSSGAATRFEPTGRHHHLFSPKTGESANRYAAITVLASRATVADALSTALFVHPDPDAASAILSNGGGSQAWFVRADGTFHHLRAAKGDGSPLTTSERSPASDRR